MRKKQTWIPAAAALLVVAGFLVPLFADDLEFELVEGEWIALHVWLPQDSVNVVLPEHLKPDRYRIDLMEDQPPGTMVDAFLIIRHGDFTLPLAGKSIEESDVLDVMLLVAVQPAEALHESNVSNFYLLEYATSDQLLNTLLTNSGIGVRSIDGTFISNNLPSTQQEIRTTIHFQGYEKWEILARSESGMHLDLGNRNWRVFFGAGRQSVRIVMHDDFYMRAVSRLSGFHENTPLDGFGDWRWADSNTLLIFTSSTTHTINR